VKQPWIVPNSTHSSWEAKKMWLDEIEEQMDFATSHYEGPVSVNFTGQDLRRMARVIRELVAILKNMGIELIHVYVEDISDDVKELFNDKIRTLS